MPSMLFRKELTRLAGELTPSSLPTLWLKCAPLALLNVPAHYLVEANFWHRMESHDLFARQPHQPPLTAAITVIRDTVGWQYFCDEYEQAMPQGDLYQADVMWSCRWEALFERHTGTPSPLARGTDCPVP
eukprot:3564491-Amphidinium_carterae.1